MNGLSFEVSDDDEETTGGKQYFRSPEASTPNFATSIHEDGNSRTMFEHDTYPTAANNYLYPAVVQMAPSPPPASSVFLSSVGNMDGPAIYPPPDVGGNYYEQVASMMGMPPPLQRPAMLPPPPPYYSPFQKHLSVEGREVITTSIPTHEVNFASEASRDVQGEQELPTGRSRYINKWSPGVLNEEASPGAASQSLATPYYHTASRTVNRQQVGSEPSSPRTAETFEQRIEAMRDYYEGELRRLEDMLSSSAKGKTASSGHSPFSSARDATIALSEENSHLQEELNVLKQKFEQQNVLIEEQASVKAQLAEAESTIERLLQENAEVESLAKLKEEKLLVESSQEKKTTIYDLEEVFRKREEDLEEKIKTQASRLRTSEAQERNFKAELNNVKSECARLKAEVEKWSTSSNRFRVERDEYASQLKEAKRQMERDAASMSQVEYQSQKAQRESTNLGAELDLKGRALHSAIEKEKSFQKKIFDLRQKNERLEYALKQTEAKSKGEWNQQLYSQEFSPKGPSSFHQADERSSIFMGQLYDNGSLNNNQNWQDDKNSGWGLDGRSRTVPTSGSPGYQNPSPYSQPRRKQFEPKSSWGGPFANYTFPDKDMVKEDKEIISPTKDRILMPFQHSGFVSHDGSMQCNVKLPQEAPPPAVIESDRFPLLESVNSIDDKLVSAEMSLTAKEAPAPEEKTERDYLSFSEAYPKRKTGGLETVSRLKNDPAQLSSRLDSAATRFGRAQKLAAKQQQSQFVIKDHCDNKSEVRVDCQQNLYKERIRRAEQAPFATEATLRKQRQEMSQIEDELVQLGLEKTRLETKLMRVESAAKKRLDARHEQKMLEARLLEVKSRSSTLRQKLKKVEGR